MHLHPNNWLPPRGRGEFLIPPVLEATFLRKDRSRSRSLPHALDRANVPGLPDYALPPCWLR